MEQRQINSQVSEPLTQLKKEAQALLDERKEIAKGHSQDEKPLEITQSVEDNNA